MRRAFERFIATIRPGRRDEELRREMAAHLASYVPARCAASVDPLVTLKEE